MPYRPPVKRAERVVIIRVVSIEAKPTITIWGAYIYPCVYTDIGIAYIDVPPAVIYIYPVPIA
jgi:hypothetical protein